jgi:hypothetical protein
MSQELSIYVNVQARTPEDGFVVSEIYPVPIPETFDLVRGDQVKLSIYLVDGEGAFDAISGASGYTLKVAVGTPGGTVAAMQDSWSLITNGWTAYINLNTQGIADLLAGAQTVKTKMEVEVTDGSGNVRTYGQRSVRILNQTISGASTVPTPVADYYTKTETNQKFVQNQSAITGLVGGTSTDLDGIPTDGIAVGIVAAVIILGVLTYYQLHAGTTAESSPDVIRPDDFDASTNAKVWVLTRQDLFGYGHTQTTPASTWNVNHGLGYRPSTVSVWISNQQRIADVEHVDNDNLTVSFRGNQIGVCRVF